MGAEVSQAVKSHLENSTLKELLSDEKWVERLREAVPVLDDDVQSNLSKLLKRKTTKRRAVSASKNDSLVQHTIAGISAQEDVPQEAAADTNTTISAAATILSTASGAASSTNAALGEDHRIRPLWETKKEEVVLPSEIAEPFERWKADPSAFLRSDSLQVPSSLKEHYDYALSVRTSTVSNKILWRFITTAYYDVISALSQSDRYSITKEAVEFVVAVICESPLYDQEAVERDIISWAKVGAKYRGLANKVGGLCCYFFYPNISEWIWIKYLPQNAYDRAAKLLLDFGIFEKAQRSGAVDLGKSIEAILKAPFQCAVPAQSYGQWILPISPKQRTNDIRDVEPCENASGPCKRKAAEEEASSRKRQRPETETEQRSSLPTPQSCQDLVAGEQHATVDISALEAPHLEGSPGNPGPQFQLPTQTKVPDTAQSIWFAINGDIDGLKYLFRRGLASPRDVSYSRGFSLMRWALYGGMHNYKTVQFLLNWGAFVDEDSYQHAWDYAYRKRCTLTELAELKCITLSTHRDWVEEQQFPLIHNIILGRTTKTLEAELDDNPDAIHVTDAMGRTALDWATALAQLSDMRLLIDHGSPLNTMDFSGRTTVLHAVDSHNDEALRIILEAGADPNPKVPEGLFRSSPLTAASFGGLVGMMKLLIEFGANVGACNPEGRTALHGVASMQSVECADILLTCGANPGYTSSNGYSPLTTAITCNNHAVLKLFINRCSTSSWKGLQLLPIIAESADAETMSIVASSELLKQTLLIEDDFATGHETLRSRMDYDKKLGNAFERLRRRGQ